MCLDIDYDGEVTLDYGSRVARKTHKCLECGREIEPGETYRWWTVKYDTIRTDKMCAHCWGTIDLGCKLTGCPAAWYWGMVHDPKEDEGGFVGDILTHTAMLSKVARFAMLRTVVHRKRGWKRQDGTLFPVPAMRPTLALASSDEREGDV